MSWPYGIRCHLPAFDSGFDSVFGEVIYLFSLSGSFFGSPPPPPYISHFMLMILSSVPRKVFATLLFTSIVNIFLCFPAFSYQETA